MVEVNEVIVSANRLHKQKDDSGLEILIGMRDKAISLNPSLKDNPDLDVPYEEQLLGAEELKLLGKKILKRWNEELFGLVCGDVAKDSKERKALLDSLNLGEAAVIAAVVGILISLGVGAAIAAPLAPLIVRRFIWPAKDELCNGWRESIRDA